MKIKWISCALFAAVLGLAGSASAGAPPQPDKVLGAGPAVTHWHSKSFDDLKAAHKPICIYIFDSAGHPTPTTILLEGDKVLGADEVKTKLDSFLCCKLNIKDKKLADGYPADWTGRAKGGGASLLLLTSDLNLVQAFDRNTPQDTLAHGVFAALEATLKANEGKAKAPEESKAKTPEKKS